MEKGEDVIFVPTIVLTECIYLIEKGKISLNLSQLFGRFRVSGNFIPISLTLDVVEELSRVKIAEMHDRIIVATARLVGAKVITKDEDIRSSGLVETVW